jgi:hypothetical protein
MRRRTNKATNKMGTREERIRLRVCLTTAIPCIILFFVPLACSPSPSSLAAVSGKTVYKEMGLGAVMALEDVTIRVFRRQDGNWQKYAQTRSGYHGSFVVHLPEGSYMLTARTILRKTTGNLELSGRLEGLVVSYSDRRVDRIVLELQPDEP